MRSDLIPQQSVRDTPLGEIREGFFIVVKDEKSRAKRRLKKRMGTLVSKMDEIDNIVRQENLWDEVGEMTLFHNFYQQAVGWVMKRGGV